jgi:NSS family neurotransmitter:Na+ symporter
MEDIMATPARWSSRTAFIFAAAAAAVGLGNVWRFPYLAGQNGGGAFVLIYLFFVVTLGIPLMTSEVILGRIGRKNPVASFSKIAKDIGKSRLWGLVGGMTIVAGLLIVSYYVVISGWLADYLVRSFIGHFNHISQVSTVSEFEALQKSPWQMLLSDTLIVGASIAVIRLGVKSGLERTVMWMFPALLLILLVLLGYAMTTGHFMQGLRFLFEPNFHRLTPSIVLQALGQAFFSLNIAMGITIMFSAYLPEKTPLVSSVLIIVLFDTCIALLAGLIIFPLVFANNLQPTAGPSLIFRTLPLAFGQLPGGGLIGALFFLLLLFAAFTSVISLF